jgi:hypothetical protein
MLLAANFSDTPMVSRLALQAASSSGHVDAETEAAGEPGPADDKSERGGASSHTMSPPNTTGFDHDEQTIDTTFI